MKQKMNVSKRIKEVRIKTIVALLNGDYKLVEMTAKELQLLGQLKKAEEEQSND